MPKTIKSFRNFKNRVHTLKWWLFSCISKRYTCGIPLSNNWIASYVRKKELSFKSKVGRHLSAASNMGKRKWHMIKGWYMDICRKNRTRTYTHYPHVFSNFSIFPFFTKRRRFIVAVCFSFSINNSNFLELRDSHDISGSQHLLNSVYVRNTGEPSACFFSWLFCRLILNFWFCFYTVPDSSLVLLYLLYLLFNSMLQCMKLIEGCWCFLSTH